MRREECTRSARKLRKEGEMQTVDLDPRGLK